MNTDHEPDPFFVQHLEWQVRTAARRAERFVDPSPTRSFARRLRTPLLAAVLMAVSAGLGAAGVGAAELVQTTRQRTLLVKRARVQVELSQTRVEHVKMEVRRIETLAQRALVTPDEVEHLRTASRRARFEVLRAARRLEEVRASGREPGTELTAPLVGGRDFVAERVAIDLLEARARLSELLASRRRAQKLVEAGVLSPSQLELGRLELARAEAEARSHERRLGIRLTWLDGELPVERVVLEVLRVETQWRLEALRARLERTRDADERARRGAAAGVVSKAELARAGEALAELEAELRLTELELELIEEKLGLGTAAESDYRGRFLAVEDALLRELGLGDYVDKLDWRHDQR